MTETPVSGSYIATEEEARSYFAGDPRATAFLALSSLAWYLQRATRAIDALPLKGHKYLRDGTQARQFPREYEGSYFDADEATGAAEVPQAILDACCEEALELYAYYSTPDRQSRQSIQEQGVKSYSLGGGYSESFGGSPQKIRHGLQSQMAYDLLDGYIARSFKIV
jgi:hypothetical protein